MERDKAMALVSADSALIREGKCTAYGNLGKFLIYIYMQTCLTLNEEKKLKTAVQVWPRGRC